jgi:two-component system, cell cycle sensor histidine kinase and response regulator CckA
LGQLQKKSAGASLNSKHSDSSEPSAANGVPYAELLNASTDIIYVLDHSGRITYANRATEAHLGWSQKDLLGKLATDIFNNSEFKERYSFLKTTPSRDLQWTGDIHYLNRHGKEVIVASHWFSKRTAKGPERLVHVGQPVTNIRKMESNFYRLQRMQALGPLAGGVVHDLNNLLGTMLLTLEEVEDAQLKLTAEQHLLLTKSTHRATLLNQQLLNFAKGTASARALVSPKKLIADLLDFTSATFPSEIEIKTECPPNAAMIFIDTIQIHQVLVNLCGNARDAMNGRGKIRIQVRPLTIIEDVIGAIEAIPAGSYVCFQISDNGKGMSPETLAKSMEPFFTTKPTGSGLGLSTCLAIIHSHGGYLDVESKAGVGTTFHIYLKSAQ